MSTDFTITTENTNNTQGNLSITTSSNLTPQTFTYNTDTSYIKAETTITPNQLLRITDTNNVLISGVLQDDTTTPIQDANILIYGLDSNVTVLTDIDGYFNYTAMSLIVGTTYTIGASTETTDAYTGCSVSFGSIALSDILTITPNTITQVLGTTTIIISGTVTNKNNVAVSGVSVDITGLSSSVATTTDANGNFSYQSSSLPVTTNYTIYASISTSVYSSVNTLIGSITISKIYATINTNSLNQINGTSAIYLSGNVQNLYSNELISNVSVFINGIESNAFVSTDTNGIFNYTTGNLTIGSIYTPNVIISSNLYISNVFTYNQITINKITANIVIDNIDQLFGTKTLQIKGNLINATTTSTINNETINFYGLDTTYTTVTDTTGKFNFTTSNLSSNTNYLLTANLDSSIYQTSTVTPFKLTQNLSSNVTTYSVEPFTSNIIINSSNRNQTYTSNSAITSSFSKFGNSSIANSIVINSIGSSTFLNDFTIEFWFYSSTNNLLVKSSIDYLFNIFFDNTDLIVNNVSTSLTLPTETWYHFACVFSYNKLAVFINGTRELFIDTVIYSSVLDSLEIQADFIDTIRLSRSSSIYSVDSTTIIVPSSQFTENTNTLLINNFENVSKWLSLSDPTITKLSSSGIFSYYYYVTNALLSNQVVLSGKNTSLDMTNVNSTLHINNVLSYWSGLWTIEFWLYTKSFSNESIIKSKTDYSIEINLTSSGNIILNLGEGSSFNIISGSSTAITLNSWRHIALVWGGNNYVLYINGSAVITVSSTLLVPINSLNNFYFGPSNSYFSNLHISNSARYTNTFTPSTSLPTRDYYSLVHNTFNGNVDTRDIITTEDTNIVSTIEITSDQYYQKSSNSIIQTNTQSKFGSYSLYIPTGNVLTIGDIGKNQLNSTWSLEYFFRNTNYTINTGNNLLNINFSNSSISANINSNLSNVNVSITSNAWHHLLLTYNTSNINIFLNGNNVITTNSLINSSTMDVLQFNGNVFIDELRVSSIVRSNTVPTVAYTTDTSTVVLNHFENVTYSLLELSDDTLSSNFTANISSTFNYRYLSYKNAALSTSNYKFGSASVYLDGNSYIVVDKINSGTLSSLTLEFWVYIDSSSTSSGVVSSGSVYSLLLNYNATSSKLEFSLGNGISWTILNNVSSTNSVNLNAWNHVAIIVGSTTSYLYLNGIQEIYNFTWANPSGLTFNLSDSTQSNSIYYSGTGSRYIPTNNSTFSISGLPYLSAANAWTIEVIFYPINDGTGGIYQAQSMSNGCWQFAYNSSGRRAQFILGNGSTYWHVTTTSLTINRNTWYHFAGVYDGTSYKFFGNGTLLETTPQTVSNTVPLSSLSSVFFGSQFVGYIDSYSTSNIARYSTNFTMPTSLPIDNNTLAYFSFDSNAEVTTGYSTGFSMSVNSLIFGASLNNRFNKLTGYYDEMLITPLQKYYGTFEPEINAYKTRTTSTLLLNHFNGVSNSTNYFSSEETNYALSTPIYTLINGYITTSTYYFGSASLYLDEISNLYINGLSLTTTYTIEFFYKFNTQISSTTQYIFALNTGETLYYSGTAWTHTTPSLTSTASFDTSNWYYICYTRSGATLTIKIINTNTNTTVTLTGTATTSAPTFIKFNTNGTSTMNIDGLRISNTATIITTVPSSEYTTVTSSTLLLNNFNGTNNSSDLYLTDSIASLNLVQSNGAMTKYNLFNCYISDSVYKFGSGSLYFNGTDTYSYLSINIGQRYIRGNWTIEFWFYPSTVGTCLMSFSSAFNTTRFLYVLLSGIGAISLTVNNTTSTGSTASNLNAWNHFILSYDGTKYWVYLNGIYQFFVTSSNLYESMFYNNIIIGRQLIHTTDNVSYNSIYTYFSNQKNYIGFIDSIMITKSCKYSGTSNISNTIYGIPQTQTYYTVLFNHTESNDLITSEDTNYVLTVPSITLNSTVYVADTFNIISKETQLFGNSTVFVGNANTLTLSGIGSNYITESWTFEFWLNGSFVSCPVISSESQTVSNWTHFADTYDFTTNTRYSFVNGVLTSNVTPTFYTLAYGNAFDNISITGNNTYIGSLKLSTLCNYTANFTPSASQFTTDSNTVVMYYFNEPHGYQYKVNYSANANVSVQSIGNTSLWSSTYFYTPPNFWSSNNFTKLYNNIYYVSYGVYTPSGSIAFSNTRAMSGESTSLYLNNNSDNFGRLRVVLNDNYILGDYTVEFWANFATLTGYLIDLIGVGSPLTNNVSGSTRVNGTNTTITVNTWYHIAVVYTNSNYNVYVNGILQFTLTNYLSNVNYFTIGQGAQFYMNRLRISNIARYTSSFTASSSYTSDTNTISFNILNGTTSSTDLLSTESSVVSLTYDTIGTVSYTGKGAAYSETIKLFDNYTIYIPSATSGFVMTGLGSNSIITPWTFEFFIYKNPTFYIYHDSTTTVNPSTSISNVFYFTGSTFTINGFVGTYTTSNLLSDWNHYAIVFTGYQVLLFINGQVTNFTVTKNSSSYNKLVTIPSASLFNSIAVAINDGYFGGVRISNNTRYTDTFTAPTTSYTTDANTIFFNNFETLSILAFLPRLTITPLSITQPAGTRSINIIGSLRNNSANINVANVDVSITGAGNLVATSNATGIFTTTTGNLTIGSSYSLSSNVSSNIYSSNITTLGNLTITNISLQLILNNIYQVFGTNRLYIDASLYNSASESNIANVSTNLYGLDTTYNLTTDDNGLVSLTTGNLVAGNVYLLTSNLTSNTYSISGLNRRTQTTTNGNTFVYTTSSYNGNITVLSNTRNQVYSLSGNSMMTTNQLKFGYASLSNAVAITSIGTSTFFTNWTIEFWFYSTTNNLILRSLVNSNLFNITFNNTTLSITIGFVSSSVSLTLTTSTWLHCAIVFEVNQLAVFIDGTRRNLVAGVVASTVLDQLFVQSGFIDELRMVRDSTIYSVSSSSITVPTQPFTLNTSTLLLNHFNGPNTSTDVMYFDDGIGIASYNYSIFSYYYSVKDTYLSNEEYLDTTNTSLKLSTTSRVYIRNLINYWNGLWTIQFWLNVSSFSNSIIFGSSLANSLELSITITGYLTLKLGKGTSWNIVTLATSTGSLSTGIWSHLALVYNNGTYSVYLDGNSVISVSSTSIPQSNFLNNLYIGSVNGYLCNLQIDRTIRYTGTFTPSTTMTTRDYYTLLQNSFNGTNGSQDLITIEDTGIINTIPTLNQNQIYTQSTTNMTVINGISQFGNGSLYMPSSSTLTISNIGGNLLTTNWTIEFFLRNSSQTLTLSDINNVFSITINSTTLTVTLYNSTSSVSNTLSTAWHYIAFVYSQNAWVLYVNSVSKVTGTTLLPSFTFDTLTFTNTNGGCYIDELRISRVSRSISTPSVAYTYDSNTILLNHFENYSVPNVIEASDEALTKYTTNTSNIFAYSYISYNNASLNTSIKKFGTASIYFDGSSGLIIDNIPVNTSTNWTLEFWVYIVSGSNTGIIVATNGNYGLQLLYNSSTSKLELSISTNGTSWNYINGTSSTNTVTTNTWNFITITSDTSYKLFINGNQEIIYTPIASANNSDYGFTYNLISNVSFSQSISYYQNGSLDLTSTSSPRGIVISASYNATNPWTIECFFYMTYMTGQNGVVMNSPTDDPAFGIVVESSNGTVGRICWLLGNNSVSGYLGWWDLGKSSTFNVNLNTWYHVAMTYDGTTYRLYLDGVLHLSNTTTNKITTTAFNNAAIGRYWSYPMTGYISHVKLSSIAKYTSAFTKPTSIDFDSSTVFLVPLTSDTTLTYYDTSIYTNTNTSYTFTGTGYTFSKTVFYADGGSLGINAGSTGSFNIINNSTINTVQPWTMEIFVRLTSYEQRVLMASGTGFYFHFDFNSNGTINLVFVNETVWHNGSNSTLQIPLNIWNHCALVYTGTQYCVYINGTEWTELRLTSSNTLHPDSFNQISLYGTNRNVSHFRLSNIAVYTNNFTKPTNLTPNNNTVIFSQLSTLTTLTAVPSLPSIPTLSTLSLGYQKQSSSITTSSNVTVIANNASNYSFRLISNAGISKSVFYQDNGSLDLTNTYSGNRGIVINGVNIIASNPWTIECFFRLSTLNSQNGILQNGQWDSSTLTGSQTTGFGIGCESSNGTTGQITWLLGNSVGYGGWFDLGKSSTQPVQRNTWHHVAVSFDGTTYRLFLDGTLYLTNTSGTPIASDSFLYLAIGRYYNYQLTGYISNVKLSNVALYTSAFTRPTRIDYDANTVFLIPLNSDSPLTYQDSNVYTNTGVSYLLFGRSFSGTGPISFSSNIAYADNSSTALNFGSLQITNTNYINTANAWTMEFFVYLTRHDTYAFLSNESQLSFYRGIQMGPSLSSGSSTSSGYLTLGNGAAYYSVSGTQPYTWGLNTWYHYAMVYTGNSYIEYQNGNIVNTVNAAPVGANSFTTFTLAGPNRYVSHLRLSNTAVYTTAFTKPTTLSPTSNSVIFAQLTNLQANLVSYTTYTNSLNTTSAQYANVFIDEINFLNTRKYYSSNISVPELPLTYRNSNTILLNHFNGNVNAKTYFDSEETNYINSLPIYTLINGNVSTSDKYFGTASVYLTSSGFLYLNNLGLSTTFTIEFFYKFNSQVSGSTRYIFALSTGETLYHSGTAWTHLTPNLTSTATFDTSNWYYICYTRSGTSLTIKIINTSTNATVTLTGTATTGVPSNVYFYTNNTTTMYIDNLRITNTANIITTVPTEPYTTLSSSVVLINNFNGTNNSTDIVSTDQLYSSLLVTSSSNSFTTYYQLYNCNVSTTKYKFGSSSLFIDGSSSFSFLTINLGQRYIRGNWTIEFWFYPTTWGEEQTNGACLLASSYTEFLGDTGNIPGLFVYIDNSVGKLNCNMYSTNRTGSTVVTKNSWHHFALVHNGNANYSVYLDGNREMNFTSYIVLDNVFTNPIIIGRQFVYNNAQSSVANYSYYSQRFASKNNFTGYIDALMISRESKYSGTTVTSHTSQQTQTYYTVLYNHFENIDIIQSEDTNYVTEYTTPMPYLTSYNAFQGYWCFLSKEYTKFSPSSLYMHPNSQQNSFFYTGLGTNVILGSWTFEIWLYGTFISNTVICASNTSNPILTINTSIPSNLRPASGLTDWTYFAESYDAVTGTRYTYVNGTLYITTTNAPIIYGSNFDQIMISTGGGYIDSFKLSDTALYTGSTITNYNTAFVTDSNTVINKSFWGPHSLNVSRKDDSLWTFSSISPGILTDGQIYEVSPYRSYTTNASVVYYTRYDVTIDTSEYASNSSGSCKIDNRTNNSIFIVGLTDNYIKGDFTFEFWFKPLTLNGVFISGFGTRSNVNSKRDDTYLSSGRINWRSATINSIINGTTTMNTSTWYHIAVVYRNATLLIYINGTLDITVSNIYYSGIETTRFRICTPSYGGSTEAAASGYVDTLRISTIARYTSSFTPSTTFTKDNYTVSLNTFDGTNGSTDLIATEDLTSVTLQYGTVSTDYTYSLSNAIINTSIGMFNSSSLYIPSGSNVRITGYNSNYLTDSWTIEYFCYSNTSILINVNGGNDKLQLNYNQGDNFNFFYDNLYLTERIVTNLSANVWNHVAIVYNNYQIKYYLNGSMSNIFANNTSFISDYVTKPSASLLTNLTFSANNGYIDSIRISDSARYSGNSYVVPTSVFTVDANTIVLNNFNSSVATKLLYLTDPIISSNYNISIDTSLFTIFYIIYGSADLSSDQSKFGSQSLNIVSNSVVIVSGFAVSTWTIDFWFYLSSTTTQTLIASYDNPFSLSITYSTNKIIMYLGNGTSWSVNSTAGTTTINTSTWYHMSIVYNGTSYVLYINGIVDRTITSTTVITFTQLLIGAEDTSYTNNTNGYIDELLITNSVLRSGTFTPPTSAYTVRLSSYQVLNHFENSTLINSEDTNFILQTVYTINDPVTIYIPGYNTNGSTSLYTSTGLYAPIQYPVNSGSVFSFSNTYSKFGSTSLTIPATNNTLSIALPGVSYTQFTVDFWYSPRTAITTSNAISLVSIGGVTFSWNLSRLITNFGVGTSSNNTLNIGTWYYIQLFFTQTNITGFINGTPVHSFTHASSPGNLNIFNIILYVGYYNNFRFMNNSIVNVPMQSIDYSYNTLQLSTQNFKFGSSSLRFYICNSLTLQYLISSSNWTVEFWFYSSNMTNATIINNTLLKVILNNTSVSLVVNNITTTSSSFSSITDTWNHLAIVESFNNVLLYLNGSMICSYAFNLTLSSLILGNAFDGFIDELRVSKYDVYTSNFTPATSAFTFTETAQVLNHFNGTNGFTVLNSNDDALIDFYNLTYETASNSVIYQNYNVVLSSAQSKWGSKSAYFDGISSYFITTVPFTSGNYTIQGWIYINDFTTNMGIFGFYSSYSLFLTLQASTRKLLLYVGVNGTSWNLNSTNLGTTTFVANTWYWISLSYNGRTWNVYVNNTLDYSLDYFNYAGNIFNKNIIVGKMIDDKGNYNQFNFNGYIDDFSVMSIAFTTLPTSVLVPYTYTLSLNHFEGTTLSNSEDTSSQISYTNPNALSYSYSASGLVAQIYYSSLPLFNCYRTIATNYDNGNQIFNIGNINSNLFNTSWTLETWALWPSASTGLHSCNLTIGPVQLSSGLVNSVSLAQTQGIQSISCLNYSIQVSITPLTFNTWYHFAVTYDNNSTLQIYINGTLYSTIPIIFYANYYVFNSLLCSGGNYASSVFINGFRSSNIVRYTSNFTVPTDFFSYDTNTLMLLNIPNNAPKWGVKYDVYDEVLFKKSNTYTSNAVTYYWINNGVTIATTPTSILGNTTALYCVNSLNSTGLGTSNATVVFADYIMNGDFTIEMWFYTPTTVRSNQCLFSFWFMGSNFVGTNVDYILGNSAFGTLSPNTWYHFAICFDSIKYVFNHYLNGTKTTTSSTYGWTRGNYFEIHPLPYWVNIGCNMNNSQNFNGYISNFRISNCTRYTSNFTVTTSNFTRDMFTVILNPFNGNSDSINLMTTENVSLVNYVNSVYNIYYSFSTANGSNSLNIAPMAYSTSIKPFNTASGSLGIGNMVIRINGMENNNCQNTWTYEIWFMLSTQVNTLFLLNSSILHQVPFQLYVQYYNSTSVLINLIGQRFYDNDGNGQVLKNPLYYQLIYSLTLNTWCHVAVSFDGDTYRLFIGGTLVFSNSYFNKLSREYWNNLTIGGSQYSSTFGGYLTGLRISNNCRYTTSFTPSTSTFTFDSNTVIGNYFGTNLNKLEFYDIGNQVATRHFDSNDTWYISNNASLSTGASKFGSRSLYLTGDNSYIKVYPSSLWYGAFTIQFWFNLTSYVDNNNPYLISSSHSTIDALSVYINRSTTRLELRMQGTSANNVYWSSNSNITVNTWNHFAFCHDPVFTNTSYAYLNGSLEGKFIGTGANIFGISTAMVPSNEPMMLKAITIGRQLITNTTTSVSNNSFNGYIDEFIYSNYPRYNANVAPSTSQKSRDMYDLVFNTFEGTTIIGSESTPVSFVYSPTYNYSFIDPYTNTINNTELTTKLSTLNMNSSLSFLNDQKRTVMISNLVQLGGSWTIEFWCYIPTITTSGITLLTFYNNSLPAAVYIDSTYSIGTNYHVWGATYTNTVKAIPNTWNHIAIQFDLIQSNIQLYINGRCGGYTSGITGMNVFKIIFKNYQVYSFYNHNSAYYISELRISNTLRYSTPTYTVPNTLFTVDTNTLLLNHFNGIDNANNLTWYNDPILLGNTNLTFVTNPSGITYTNFGTQLSNTRVKYGSTALSISNAYLIIQNLSLTGTEWSIEMWYYPTTSLGTLFSDYRADYKLAVIHNNSLYLYVGDDTSWSIVNGLTSGNNIATNTWHHVAVVFSGLTYYLYLNGNLELSVASTINIQNA
jgi:hypothetical protein